MAQAGARHIVERVHVASRQILSVEPRVFARERRHMARVMDAIVNAVFGFFAHGRQCGAKMRVGMGIVQLVVHGLQGENRAATVIGREQALSKRVHA